MKKTKIIFWLSTGFIFLMEGIMPMSTLLFMPEYMNAGTKPLGYPDYFAVTLILFKFVGALTILLPSMPDRLREWAYAGLTFNLVFAVISHIVVDGNITFILTPVVVLGILALSYFSSKKMSVTKVQERRKGMILQGA
ncbi:DoxX family protein [Chitinophaga lutea]